MHSSQQTMVSEEKNIYYNNLFFPTVINNFVVGGLNMFCLQEKKIRSVILGVLDVSSKVSKGTVFVAITNEPIV